MPSTPPTSPQRHQAAARQSERDNCLMGSPEQRREPAASTSSAVQPPSRVPTTFGGRVYHNLPQNLAAMAAAISAQPPLPPQHYGHSSAASMLAPAPVSLFICCFFIYCT
jgi:hypothetical protein